MTNLDAQQEGRLNDLKRAWKAQSLAMTELLERQAKERDELQEQMYAEVVKATAHALEVSVPKSRLGKATGTANYSANRKGLHADALALLETFEVKAAVKKATDLDLRDEEQAEEWARNLVLTYVGVDRNMDMFKVQDPAGLIETLYDGGMFPACYDEGVTPAIEAATVDQADIIKQKMQEAKN